MHFDAGCACSQGLLLADYLKSLLTGQNLPQDLAQQAADDNSRFLNPYAPGQPLSIARPAELPGSDLTDAFTPQSPGAGTPPTAPAPTWGHGMQVHPTYFSQEAKQLTLGPVRQAGFNWIKHQVEWLEIQTGPEQYDWAELDSIVNSAENDGLKVQLSVLHAPPFLRSPTSGLFPRDPDSFETFMELLAHRYRGKVLAYGLWNEQNLARES